MHCRILCCLPASPADVKRVDVFQVSTTKRTTAQGQTLHSGVTTA